MPVRVTSPMAQAASFSTLFSADEIDELQLLPKAMKADCTFVRKAVQMLYKDDLRLLLNKSVKQMRGQVRSRNGVMKTYPTKLALTPEKVKSIRTVYNKRLENCVDSQEFEKRFSDAYFNKKLNAAISNNAKKITD